MNKTQSESASQPSQISAKEDSKGSKGLKKRGQMKGAMIVQENNRPIETVGSETRRRKNQPVRVETTGEKQSQAQIEVMQSEEHDGQIGSVNIQTDAVSFDKNQAIDLRSSTTSKLTSRLTNYKKQASQVSYKTKSSIMSKGMPQMPGAIPHKRMKGARKESRPDILNVSVMTGGESHAENKFHKPEHINRQIQRDLARQEANSSVIDHLGMPGSKQESSALGSDHLFVPFQLAPTIQKQQTGRDDKKQPTSESLLGFGGDSGGLGGFLQLGFNRIQRGFTKQEKQGDEQDRVSIDPRLAVTSIKSITRPSNVSGFASVISPGSQHGPNDSDNSDDSEFRDRDMRVIQLEILDHSRAVSGNSGHGSDYKKDHKVKSRTDVQSNKSFKTRDSKTIVEVETKIRMLDAGKEKSKIQQQQPSETSSNRKKAIVSKQRDVPSEGQIKAEKKNLKARLAHAASSNDGSSKSSIHYSMTRIQKQRMMSTGEYRDAMNDKGKQDGTDSKQPITLDSPASQDRGKSAAAIEKGGLKSMQGGLVSIDEKPEQLQPEVTLGATSPQAENNRANNFKNRSNKDKDPLDCIVRDKRSGKGGRKLSSRREENSPEEEQDQWRRVTHMKFQMYAADFYTQVTGDTNAADPEKIAELICQEDMSDSIKLQKEIKGDLNAPEAQKSKFAKYRIRKPKKAKGSFMKLQQEKDEIQAPGLTSAELNAQRRNALVPLAQDMDFAQALLMGENERVTNLEDEVAKLKDVIERQRAFQEQLNTQMSQTQSACGKNRNFIVNKGNIGSVHQPVFNINFIQGSQVASDADLQSDLVQDEGNNTNNQNSANTFISAERQARKKRPLTAAGLGAKRNIQQQIVQSEQDHLLQPQPSSIDFQLAERPISAATLQKKATRNQRRQLVTSDSYVSNNRHKQQQKLSKLLEHVGERVVEMPLAGQRRRDKQNEIKEHIAVRELIRDGHFFHPETNIGCDRGVKRTQSCYLNANNRKSSKGIVPNTQYVQTASGRTGYAAIPNMSQKILEKAIKEEPQCLTRQDPLGLSSEPMRSLKGPLLSEMVYLNKQKNRGLGRKSKITSNQGVSRHSKLQQQAGKSQHPNDDLFFSPIDDYLRENDASSVESENESASVESKSSDSRDSVPGLTGGAHILMERDLMENKYALVQGDKKIVLDQKHFDPIFFSNKAEELKNNVEARMALRQFKIFVRPDDIHLETKSAAGSMMNNSENLEKLLRCQQEKDLAIYYAKQPNGLSMLVKQLDRIIENKPPTASKSSHPRGTSSKKYAHVKSKVKEWTRNQSASHQRRQQMIKNQLGPLNTHGRSDRAPDTKKTQTSRVLSSSADNPFCNLFGRDSTKRIDPQPLSQNSEALISRLARRNEPTTREKIRERIRDNQQNNEVEESEEEKDVPEKKKAHSPAIRKRRGSQQKSNPLTKQFRSSPQQQSPEEDKSRKGSPPQTSSIIGGAHFRPFSASTGGGAYPTRLLQQQQVQKIEALKHSKTPKPAQLTSKDSYQPRQPEQAFLERSSVNTTPTKPSKKKSFISEGQMPVNPQAAAATRHKATSSSNKSMTQKTVTVASDRKTDGTAVQTMIRHLDSKFSESHTNVESEKTDKTLIGKLPSNISSPLIVVPSLTHHLDSDQGQKSSEGDYELQLRNNDLSAESAAILPQKPVIILTQDDSWTGQTRQFKPLSDLQREPASPPNIEVSVMPLDETTDFNNNVEQVVLVSSTASAPDSKDNLMHDSVEIEHRQTFGNKDGCVLNLVKQSQASESEQQNLIEDSPLSGDSKEQEDECSEIRDDQKQQSGGKVLKVAEKLRVVRERVGNEDTSSTPDLGSKQLDKSIPQLMINAVDKNKRRQSIMPNTNNPINAEILSMMKQIAPTTKNNTDRIRQDTMVAQSSREEVRKQKFLDLPDQALNVPIGNRNRNCQLRQKTKDSQSSVLTPMFKDHKHRGGSPSAQSASDFSFAADLNRREILGEFKNSQTSNQSRMNTKGKGVGVMSPSMMSKRHEEYSHSSQANALICESDELSLVQTNGLEEDIEKQLYGAKQIKINLLDVDDGNQNDIGNNASQKSAQFEQLKEDK